MRPTSLRRRPAALAAFAALALVLAACSSPKSPEATQNEYPMVELDGFKAQIQMPKIDPEALSTQGLARTTSCDHNVGYRQVVVPMLGIDDGRLSPYVDVFWMPSRWNKKLALYAHGYIGPDEPSFLDQIADASGSAAPMLKTLDLLLCEGYALGASSFAAQGYAVQQGIAETHLMNAVFPLIFWRRPSKTYVFGSSMGGLITIALAELFPGRYDGAMPTCGPLAGSLAEFSYVGNARLLFDTAFPPMVHGTPSDRVLRGTLTDWESDDTDPTSPTYWAARVRNAIATNPEMFAALANTAVNYTSSLGLPLLQTPATYGNFGDVLSRDLPTGDLLLATVTAANALLHALRYTVEGGGDAIHRGGGSPFSNSDVSYDGLLPAAFINPKATPPYGTGTFVADPRAVAYYTLFYQPSGNLHVPTLSLHTGYDPDVPTVHEKLYRDLVAARLGTPDPSATLRSYVVSGYVPDDLKLMIDQAFAVADRDPPTFTDLTTYGHCNFLPTDLVTAINVLDHRAMTLRWDRAGGIGSLGAHFTRLEDFPLSSTP